MHSISSIEKRALNVLKLNIDVGLRQNINYKKLFCVSWDQFNKKKME